MATITIIKHHIITLLLLLSITIANNMTINITVNITVTVSLTILGAGGSRRAGRRAAGETGGLPRRGII